MKLLLELFRDLLDMPKNLCRINDSCDRHQSNGGLKWKKKPNGKGGDLEEFGNAIEIENLGGDSKA